MIRQITWLAPVVLCGCVAVAANFYEPRGPGDVESVSGGCSMAPRFRLTRHLPAHVDVEVIVVAKTPGISHALLTISIRVPAGATVRLIDPTITLRDGPSAPPIRIRIDRIRKPRTLVNGQVSDYLAPGDVLSGPAGYGIEAELPLENPAELIVTPPPLSIDSQPVEVGPAEFDLKSRPHVTGFC